MKTKNWIPEIMYEDDDNGLTSNIPFIMVPQEEIMPKVIFIFEAKQTPPLTFDTKYKNVQKLAHLQVGHVDAPAPGFLVEVGFRRW